MEVLCREEEQNRVEKDMVWGYESWKSWSTDLWIKSLYLNSNMYLFSHYLLPQGSQISQPWPWYPPSLGAWGLPAGTLEPLLVPSLALQHFQAPPRRGGTHSFTHLWGLCVAHGEWGHRKASSRCCWNWGGDRLWGSRCPSKSIAFLCLALVWLFWRFLRTQDLSLFSLFYEMWRNRKGNLLPRDT